MVRSMLRPGSALILLLIFLMDPRPAFAAAEPVIDEKLLHILEVAAERQGPQDFAATVEILLAAEFGDAGDPAARRAFIARARALKPEAAGLLLPSGEAVTPKATADAVASGKRGTGRQSGLFSLGPWDGSIEAGFSTSSGNTREQAAALGIEFGRVISERWEHKIDIDIDYARRAGLTSKERYAALYELYYRGWDRAYIYSFLDGERNRFSGFEYRITESAGAGYQIIDSERQKWSVEGGPGLRQTKLDLGGIQNKLIGVLSTNYQFLLNPDVVFTEKARIFSGEARTTLETETGIKVRLNAALSARFSFHLKYDSEVPPGSRHTDTLSRATIVYDF